MNDSKIILFDNYFLRSIQFDKILICFIDNILRKSDKFLEIKPIAFVKIIFLVQELCQFEIVFVILFNLILNISFLQFCNELIPPYDSIAIFIFGLKVGSNFRLVVAEAYVSNDDKKNQMFHFCFYYIMHYDNLLLMLIKNLFRQAYSFKVVKRNSGDKAVPLKNMEQYYLTSDSGQILSFWNDIPIGLKNDLVNCCIQIPRQKCSKFQVIKSEEFHPIMQDTKKNVFTKEEELRYYAQFPLFNYGFIPQTWEQNIIKDEMGLYGDDDPIDICELSQSQKQLGDIFQGKILGSFCLIDQGEVDWKIFTIESKEAAQKKIETISDVDPRLIQSVMNWFKGIKIFDGKKPNSIAHGEKIFDKRETLQIIMQTHTEWKKLQSNSGQKQEQIRAKYHLNKLKV